MLKEASVFVAKNLVNVVDVAIEGERANLLQPLAKLFLMPSLELLPLLRSCIVAERRVSASSATRRNIVKKHLE
jgi:hypothetical protein